VAKPSLHLSWSRAARCPRGRCWAAACPAFQFQFQKGPPPRRNTPTTPGGLRCYAHVHVTMAGHRHGRQHKSGSEGLLIRGLPEPSESIPRACALRGSTAYPAYRATPHASPTRVYLADGADSPPLPSRPLFPAPLVVNFLLLFSLRVRCRCPRPRSHSVGLTRLRWVIGNEPVVLYPNTQHAQHR
jgi:hypothetical protein